MSKNLTEEEIDFIKNLSKEITTQDTRCTAKPYGLIIGEKKRVVTDYDNCQEKAIYWNECDYDTFEDWFEAIKDYYLEGNRTNIIVDYIQKHCSDIDDVRNYESELYRLMDECPRAYGYNIEEVFNPDGHGVNFFLTDKSAKEFLERNRHNLTNPFTYGIHLYRNQEMKQLIDIIVKLGASL